MQQVTQLESNRKLVPDYRTATAIPKLTHDEAAEIAQFELGRFVDLLETLEGDDWSQPTACTLWTVKDIVAHQAAWVSGWTSIRNAIDLFNMNRLRPYLKQGMSMLDATNQSQVDLRAGYTAEQLIEEVRQQGPNEIAFRKSLNAVMRLLPMPDGGSGMISLGYLTDVILTRDMWMHRLDICHATRREFVQTVDHDGRIVALVVRDLVNKLLPILNGQSVVYELTGICGGTWQIGHAPAPSAILKMDVLDFNMLASQRITAENMLSQSRVTITGDEALAHTALEHTKVLY